MKKNQNIAFIGSGKMAEAMIRGLLREGIFPPEQILACGPRRERGEELENEFGIITNTSNLVSTVADIIVFSVKPQTMSRVLSELKGQIPEKTLVISIAAGVRILTLCEGLAVKQVVRAMPNTPALIGRGVTVWCASTLVMPEQKDETRKLFGAFSDETFVEDERYLDMATAVSGTGPAIAFLFMEAFTEAGVRIGLPRHLSRHLVLKTLNGSVEYAEKAGEHLAHLRDNVTSPAGTSAAAIRQLEKLGFRSAIDEAITAAYKRSIELGS